jgi:tetrapyrrole methylase family protein/MazG family protein|tara:strand:- start:14278 stop:15036 length:759 start_codon:yes stop_codon:yes gene_type:complete
LSNISKKLNNLIEITKALRAKDGCPWDKEQTFKSLKRYIIEEAYEVIDAIDDEDYINLEEEIGDFLLQVIFLSNIAEEQGLFKFEDVVAKLTEKLIRRHPHVFGDKKANNAEEAIEIWNTQKSKEKLNSEKEFSKASPSLVRAIRASKAFTGYGLEWNSLNDIVTSLYSEIEEFNEAVKSKSENEIEEELGDILFTVANLCRWSKMNPEISLNKSTDKFLKRAKLFIELKSKGLSDNEAWVEAKLLCKEDLK